MENQQTVDFDLEKWLPLLATVYGEVANQDYNTKVHVISSILNRAESGREEFGAHTGRLTDVLARGYYAYSKKSPKFMEAINRSFPDKPSENSFKEIIAIFSGIMKGKIPRTQTLFFLTPTEVARIKKTKSMNMDLLDKVDQNDTYIFYKYKELKPTTKGRKLAK